jgi:hypothetical protein
MLLRFALALAIFCAACGAADDIDRLDVVNKPMERNR